MKGEQEVMVQTHGFNEVVTNTILRTCAWAGQGANANARPPCSHVCDGDGVVISVLNGSA
jgi:hypothetical protein